YAQTVIFSFEIKISIKVNNKLIVEKGSIENYVSIHVIFFQRIMHLKNLSTNNFHFNALYFYIILKRIRMQEIATKREKKAKNLVILNGAMANWGLYMNSKSKTFFLGLIIMFT
ncbi:hypothetical protein ACJX0J_020960, partial [Zea mays]